MIFVILGSQKFQFDRLLKAVDDLFEQGKLKEEVFAQSGCSTYQPKHYAYEPYLSADDFVKHVEEADLVISHAGTGAIMKAIKRHKRVIVVPRLGQYAEHVDDHQCQISEMFSGLDMIVECRDTTKLAEAIDEARVKTFRPYVSNTQAYIDALDKYIQSI